MAFHGTRREYLEMYERFTDARERVRDPQHYRRMKNVRRHSDGTGWEAEIRWGPEYLNCYFADTAWGGPEAALVAANAFAADCYLALGKPITTRLTHYRAKSDSSTGELNVYRSRSGAYYIQIQEGTQQGSRTAIRIPFPLGTALDEVLSVRDETMRSVYAMHPITYYR